MAEPTSGRPTRRHVLGGIAAGALAAGMPGMAFGDDEPASEPAPEHPMPTRTLGKTGRRVSLFGLGCFPLGALTAERAGVEIVLAALHAGCTYLDTAPTYKRGQSERRVGLAMREWGKRADVFVSTKTTERDPDAARRDLEASLKRLQMDHVDMVQVHAVRDAADLERVLDLKRGPLKALLAAQAEGLVTHIGVTGHADPLVIREALKSGHFASVLMPLNCVDPHHLSFVAQTLPAAVEAGIGRLAMKVFASGALPKRGVDPASCLRFTYGLNVSSAVVGCRTLAEVELAATVACAQQPLSAAEHKALLLETAAHKGKAVEWYKRA